MSLNASLNKNVILSLRRVIQLRSVQLTGGNATENSRDGQVDVMDTATLFLCVVAGDIHVTASGQLLVHDMKL